jgi:hypothetical protein
MEFASADPSAIRSIKQRMLLQSWMRALRDEKLLPLTGDFQPDGIANELADMMAFDIDEDDGTARFLITQEGWRMAAAYGGVQIDPVLGRTKRYLDDVVEADGYAHILPCYQACLTRKRPVYSISRVVDIEGKDVSYERLLLPFGRDDEVEQIIGSYKAISVRDGSAVLNLRPLGKNNASVRIVSAVIDSPSSSRAGNRRAENMIVPESRRDLTFPVSLPWHRYPA